MRNKLVINVDDYSMNSLADERIVFLLKEGLITSISVTATSLNFYASLEKIASYDRLIDIGVHLDLTHGNPVLRKDIETFRCNGGNVKLSSITSAQVFEEFEAQVQKCIDTGLHITHIDNHRPEIYFFPHLFSEVIKIAAKRGLFFRNPFDSRFITSIATYVKAFGIKKETLVSLHGFYSNFQRRIGAECLDVLLLFDECSRDPEDFERLVLTPYDGKIELLTHAGQCQKPFDGEYALLVSKKKLLLEEIDLCRR